MKILLRLAMRSAWNRRFTLGLMLVAIALSTTMLLGIERVRHEVRAGFSQSVSGTDLVVGARTSPIQLMLYAIFRIGGATNNIGWDSAQALARNPAVAWTIPISLGDSHRGFSVLATNGDYFTHFRYGSNQPLRLTQGHPMAGVFDAVLGADVAAKLHYHLGDIIILSHGMGGMGLTQHADKPFRVVGILARTGTPVDRTVHIGLDGMQAIHLDWEGGAPLPGVHIPAEFVKKFNLTPTSITAVLVGLKSRARVFALQREIASGQGYKEPLMAVLPGVALDQLWDVVGIGENALLVVSGMVVVVGLAGLVAAILASLGERRRELAILRSVGARPLDVLLLLCIEGLGVMLAGVASGLLLLSLLVWTLGPLLAEQFGIALQPAWPAAGELQLLLWTVLAGLVASLLPALRAYRLSLSDGLTPRI
ncbi:ABC transporter permease [Herbaspirillum seropedicae]|uniref:ABC-type antimicrobial peptide transport system, permease component protein n=1 Tax=Herbaspirillum seropedicae (strain SmR1) TaxID=757424 RepID=D8J182_HERSS|nr:ABC transporter permease [Herbaspirillum seropedicae]ADJ64651.1 ABC-type antimicrobial peptide transport system, permease component protein [Herbaspirillum seropedicae SmR1]AKN66569.1 peptide ABC transporter permease [Herbaspirillum seropedicae]NQE28439.1 peptide ABC transporter permease [Herbaspirillum seropedicae]UMU22560.1 ABC transporter permease [Herbaspirillum seropedicae]